MPREDGQFKDGNPGGPGRPKGRSLRAILRRRLREPDAVGDTKGDQWIGQLMEWVEAGQVPMLDVLKWLEGASPPQKQGGPQQSGDVDLRWTDDDHRAEAGP
jgi:hypothetical protein